MIADTPGILGIAFFFKHGGAQGFFSSKLHDKRTLSFDAQAHAASKLKIRLSQNLLEKKPKAPPMFGH